MFTGNLSFFLSLVLILYYVLCRVSKTTRYIFLYFNNNYFLVNMDNIYNIISFKPKMFCFIRKKIL